MEQYINKAALVAEIDNMLKTKEQTSHLDNNAFNSGRWKALKKVKDILNTFEVKEADLDYIKDELDRVVKIYKPNGDFGWGTLYNIATHFFELGLNTQRSSIDFSNIDDTIKDMGIEPNSKEAKLFKEAYFIALDKYIAQKGE